ncbi:hypothetical protein BUALT_Bualt09G0109700 [Buddleja alternifolia]|uniref:RRM domain-containing protein n=1 Tax=Buddleja alternifolia TaxID=168488 RepID=A0AAV6X8Y8_9LAMI|nr:hypothetical protein BUALT_Bualt09G0109700 [Buddleja alternifolia]
MANLDRTLDDMIQMNRTPRAGPRQSGPGPTRRFSNRFASRAAPYAFSAGRAPENRWDHDGMFAEELHTASFPVRGGAGVSAIETGTKLLISNLHYGVSDDDIKELFSGVGDLKRCSVHYDRSGRSEGTAEVVFYRRRDAEAAIKRYNNVQLDGKPMKIEIVGMNMASPPMLPQASLGGYRINRGGPIRNARAQGRGGAIRGSRGGAPGMRRGRGGGRGHDEKISAEDLDADLEKYLAGAKETN